MIRIESFDVSHVLRLDAIEKGKAPPDLLRLGTSSGYDAEALVSGGPAYTAMEEDIVLLCAGMICKWAGLWEAWCIMSPFAVDRPSLHKWVRKKIEGLEKEYSIRRLQAFVRRDYMEGKMYLAFLGFHAEAVLKKYGPKGEDMVVYVRFGNGN